MSAAPRWSRRDFLHLSAAGLAGLAAEPLILPATGLVRAAPCDDLLNIRTLIHNATLEIENSFAVMEAAGLPWAQPVPPLPPPVVAQLKSQMTASAVHLADALRPYPRSLLEQAVAEPAYGPLIRLASDHNFDLVPSAAEIQSSLFAPTQFVSNIGIKSKGYAIFCVILAALCGLNETEIAQIQASGILEMFITFLEDLASAITKGDFKKAKKVLKTLMEAIALVVEQMGLKLGKVAIKALKKFLEKFAGFFGIILGLAALAVAIYDNWETLKEHFLQ